MIDVNLWGVIHGVHSFLPHMKRIPGGGHIVNTSSMAGLMAGPTFGAYCVSKYGVVALTEVLYQELELEGSMVSASVLLPGPTHTQIATSSRNRPDTSDAALEDLDLRDVDLFGGSIPWKSPDEVGEIVLQGILNRELYLFTHPDLTDPILKRFREIESAALYQGALIRTHGPIGAVRVT